jgi:hypothetical protein
VAKKRTPIVDVEMAEIDAVLERAESQMSHDDVKLLQGMADTSDSVDAPSGSCRSQPGVVDAVELPDCGGKPNRRPDELSLRACDDATTNLGSKESHSALWKLEGPKDLERLKPPF